MAVCTTTLEDLSSLTTMTTTPAMTTMDLTICAREETTSLTLKEAHSNNLAPTWTMLETSKDSLTVSVMPTLTTIQFHHPHYD